MRQTAGKTRAIAAATLALVTAGCGAIQLGKDEPATPSTPAHWRNTQQAEEREAAEGPGGVFSAIIYGFGDSIDPSVDPPAYYRHQYSLWRSDHKNLARQMGRNSRGTTELMRQIVGSVSGMKEMLQSEEQRAELTQIQLRYESIAEKSTQGFSPQAFSLALDKIKWKIEKKYKPGSEGLVYRPQSYFREREQQEFEEEEEF